MELKVLKVLSRSTNPVIKRANVETVVQGVMVKGKVTPSFEKIVVDTPLRADMTESEVASIERDIDAIWANKESDDTFVLPPFYNIERIDEQAYLCLIEGPEGYKGNQVLPASFIDENTLASFLANENKPTEGIVEAVKKGRQANNPV